MWKNQYVIVDDIFSGFSKNHSEVLTRSDFYEKLLKEKIDQENVNLVLGQGVNRRDIEGLVESLSEASQKFTFLENSLFVKACQRNTHKHRSQNIMVSVANQVGEDEYELNFVLDSANEFLMDHMTGQHVQGMAIIEACRQAFLSVTEQFFLYHESRDFYFIINNISIDYRSFLFPIVSVIRYKILSKDIQEDKLSFNVLIDLVQCGKVCSSCEIKFAAYEYSVISEKENGIARKVIDSLSEQWQEKKTIETAA